MMPILILAAGASKRMHGRDKLLEDVDGAPLLRRQAKLARSVSEDVRVALPPRPHPRYDALRGLDVALIEVAEASEGMNASLRTAFSTLPPGTGHAMLLLADLPDIEAEDLQKVIEAMDEAPSALIWRGATAERKGGHPMIFHHSLFDEIAGLKGDDGGQSVVSKAGKRVHLVPLGGQRARLDLDTPEDWAAWRAARH